MAKPTPYVYCPTKESMDAAIRTLYAAGYTYGSMSVAWLMAVLPNDGACSRYPCLVYNGRLGPYAADSPDVLNGTRCNSPAHMIAYLRTNHGKA